MGSAITAITFPCFLTVSERNNPRDYFRMEIIEEIGFFFFYVEDPPRNQKLRADDVKIEKQGTWFAKEGTLKST